MRLVIDTNVLVSALMIGTSAPARLLVLWREGRFGLLTSAVQLDELMRVTRYPKIRARISPMLGGRLVNELRKAAIVIDDLPPVTVCPDPNDNHLLALATAGQADFLVTGDKRDLLPIERHQGTRITTVRDFLSLVGRPR